MVNVKGLSKVDAIKYAEDMVKSLQESLELGTNLPEGVVKALQDDLNAWQAFLAEPSAHRSYK